MCTGYIQIPHHLVQYKGLEHLRISVSVGGSWAQSPRYQGMTLLPTKADLGKRGLSTSSYTAFSQPRHTGYPDL